MLQDAAAIPILALLPLPGADSVPNGPLAQVDHAQEAIKMVAVIAGIVLGGRLLMRPLFRWIARSKTPEMFAAASQLHAQHRHLAQGHANFR